MKTFKEFYYIESEQQVDEDLKSLVGSAVLAGTLLAGGASAEAKQHHHGVGQVTHSIANLASVSAEEKIARTLFAEAAGESFEGKKAIASVIYNRAGGDVNKMVKVVTAPKQFSCWNAGMPKRGSGKAWDDSVKLAKELLSGNFKSTTKHTHYYNPKLVNPTWAYKKTASGKVRRLYQDIGNHRFLTI